MRSNDVKTLAANSSRRLSVLRKMKELVDQEALLMEFVPLTWGATPESYLRSLDAFQRRAEKVIYGQNEGRLGSLQRRRHVPGLAVSFKATKKQTQHLHDLRALPSVPTQATRAAAASAHQARISRASTSQFQREFMYTYSIF